MSLIEATQTDGDTAADRHRQMHRQTRISEQTDRKVTHKPLSLFYRMSKLV